MKALELRKIEKRFGNTRVLSDLSLEVEPGSFCVLLGPSGCGKSTLLRLIAGLDSPTSGDILINGRTVTGLEPVDRDVAMVFQSYALYPHMTVRENLAFPLRLQKIGKSERDGRVREAAALLRIDGYLDRLPRELSGGQRQRVAIGRAIVRRPKLFLFDEPLSNLDAQLRSATRSELARLHQELGITVVYVTHDQVEAMTLGSRIAVLNKGRIEQLGPPGELYDRPATLFTASFIGEPAINLLSGKAKGGRFAGQGLTLELDPGLRGYSGELTIGVRPEDLQVMGGQHEGKSRGKPWTGTLERVENLGSQRLLYVRAGDTTLVMRSMAASPPAPGAALNFHPTRVHFFEGSGKRIGTRGGLTSGGTAD
ncbi:MAG TPA: ABC transporter ATP-binding protein [Nitrospiria bacterium]